MSCGSATGGEIEAAAALLWPAEALDAIGEASFELLERVGVRVESAVARELLEEVSCQPGPQERTLVPRAVVEAALVARPPSFTLLARDPARSLVVDADPGPTYVHTMGGAADVVNPQTGDVRRATLRDQAETARVVHHLANIDMAGAVFQPGDVPGVLEPLYSYLAIAGETDKFVAGPGISSPFQARHIEHMAGILLGDATGAPRACGGRLNNDYPMAMAFSPVSPLHLGADVADALVWSARAGVAVTLLPCPAVGTTAPASLAAAVAQQHAEILAGVVLAQAARPGTPVICGPRLSAIDPRTGRVASGGPEMGFASIAAVLLARRCGLACDCYGPTSDSKVADAQLGWEHAFNAMLGLLARPRFLSGPGDIQTGVASALEIIVLDDQILNDARYALKQRAWDGSALDAAAMAEGVLAGSFLGSRHTRRYLRSELCPPLLSYRGGLQEWIAAGRRTIVEVAHERVEQLLAREPVGLPEPIEQALCGVIGEAAREAGLSEWPDPVSLIHEVADVV